MEAGIVADLPRRHDRATPTTLRRVETGPAARPRPRASTKIRAALNPGARITSNRADEVHRFDSSHQGAFAMRKNTSLAAIGLSLAAALGAAPALAQNGPPRPLQGATQAQARVTSVNQVSQSDGSVAYDVTYEFDGRPYQMRTPVYPGATVPVEVNAYGVATLPASPMDAASPQADDRRQAWNQVVPEPGVVVSAGARAAPPVYYPAPAYAAPVYVQPGYGYGYAAPYFYPPVGVSLNLGYSRGWGGGHYRHGWR
jgi:hypothetical protein